MNQLIIDLDTLTRASATVFGNFLFTYVEQSGKSPADAVVRRPLADAPIVVVRPAAAGPTTQQSDAMDETGGIRAAAPSAAPLAPPAPSTAAVPAVPTAPVDPTVFSTGSAASAPPAPTAPTAGATTESAQPDPLAPDADGLVWDARIHSAEPTLTEKRMWRRRRGLNDAALEASVKAELRARVAPIAPQAPVVADAPPAPVDPAVALVSKITDNVAATMIEDDEVQACCTAVGLVNLLALFGAAKTDPGIVARLDAEIDKVLNSA